MPKRSRTVAREVAFTHPEKIYFPGSGTTKGEVIQYYLDVARWILPHFRQRPVTLIRFPNGYGGESFYEKNAPRHTPDWVKTFQVPRRRHEGTINYILIEDPETLAWCVNLGAIELHPFLHRAERLDEPTHLAFDLDPGEGADLVTCARVGFLLREVLAGLGLEAWPKVTGSKGLQLYVPLNSGATYAVATPFARTVAELLEREHPDLVVSNMARQLRRGRVLIDWSQNSASKTTVGPYVIRAKRDRPFVSMPVAWEELERAVRAGRPDALFFPPDAVRRRLAEQGDRFAPVLELRQDLPEAFTTAVAPGSTAPKRRSRTRATSSLGEYARRRNFAVTAEPPPGEPPAAPAGAPGRFVIQKHAASHLHYDFRLELDGTLKSWAVPKGLPTDVQVRRSAFETEDHPLEYLEFEGTIPAGQYGGGTVMVWDLGTYELVSGSHRRGSLRVRLHGQKLTGEWQLYRIREENGKNVWLVEKREGPARAIGAKRDDTSVLTGRSMSRIASDHDAQWQSGRETRVGSTPRPRRRPAPARKRARPAAVRRPSRTRRRPPA